MIDYCIIVKFATMRNASNNFTLITRRSWEIRYRATIANEYYVNVKYSRYKNALSHRECYDFLLINRSKLFPCYLDVRRNYVHF